MEAVKDDTFELTVVRVAGGGNTDDGKYFYSFSPSIVMASTAGYLHFVLSKDSSRGIRIHAVVDSGNSGQLQPARIHKGGKSAKVYDTMSAPALINVAVVVTDDLENEPRYIVCDPQVINVPD